MHIRGGGNAVLLMLVSICVNYIGGIFLSIFSKNNIRKLILLVDIIFNIGLLYYFKYLDYTITIYNYFTKQNVDILNIALPVGISFFTFQAMSYVIDVYRKDAPPEKNILNIGLYISFFPQLVAGPIVRYNSIAEQIKKRDSSLDKFGTGVKRFICGFCKKIILSNNLAIVADNAFLYGDLHNLPVSLAWIGSVSFSLQIYFDFSGYSDMAIGLGKMFGFDFEENFNYPYISKTITEFWRRWHISLSRWFRDYVYFPLGGSRVKPLRHIINLLTVWVLTGLWHGADITFAAWGLMYFIMLVFEKYILKPEKKNSKIFGFMWRVITLLVVNFGWILFHMESFNGAVEYIKAMFGLYGNTLVCDTTLMVIREYGIFIAFGFIFSAPVVPQVYLKSQGNRVGKAVSIYIVPICYFMIFIWAVSFLILGAHNPFIYFNF